MAAGRRTRPSPHEAGVHRRFSQRKEFSHTSVIELCHRDRNGKRKMEKFRMKMDECGKVAIMPNNFQLAHYTLVANTFGITKKKNVAGQRPSSVPFDTYRNE